MAPSSKQLPITIYPLPTSFSFSQLRAFQVCPYQYKLAYLLQIPVKQRHYFSFGTTVHVTLQRFYERMQMTNGRQQGSLFGLGTEVKAVKSSDPKAPTLDELLNFYDANWIPDWYESKSQREAYYKKGKDILREFYKRHDGSWTVPVALEKGFKIKVGEYLVTGKIDRVDQLADGSLHIIDYKTGQTKDSVTGDDKDQLLLYQLAALGVPWFYHLGVPGKLTYYYLTDGVETSFVGKEKDLQALEVKIIHTIDEIRAADWSQITKKSGCGRCEFCRI